MAFTGSTEVGYTVAAAGRHRLIPSTLELGGNRPTSSSPRPVRQGPGGHPARHPFNQGQVCSAGSRIFYPRDVYDTYVAAATAAFPASRWAALGEGHGHGHADQPPPVGEDTGLLEVGQEEGAKVAVGGKRMADAPLDKGSFMQPTLLVDVKNSMAWPGRKSSAGGLLHQFSG
jgi:acyl-CoA reductase-like NAD-dependent aldehyde dehydrogenase